MSKKRSKTAEATKERKLCIVEKIIYALEKLVLQKNTSEDVLPIFKSFMLALEQKTPQVHALHDTAICIFLCYFCRYKNWISPKQFKPFNIEGSVRKMQSMFVVGSNHVFISKLWKWKLCSALRDYYSVLKGAYITVAKYILSRFLTDNKLLMCLPAIDLIYFPSDNPKHSIC